MKKDEIVAKWKAEFPDSKFDEDFGALLIDMPSTKYIFIVENHDENELDVYLTTKEYFDKHGYINDQNYDIIRSEDTDDDYGYINIVDTSIIKELASMNISEYTDMESCWCFGPSSNEMADGKKMVEALRANPRFIEEK